MPMRSKLGTGDAERPGAVKLVSEKQTDTCQVLPISLSTPYPIHSMGLDYMPTLRWFAGSM